MRSDWDEVDDGSEMRSGAAASGAVHVGLILLAVFGADLFPGGDGALMDVSQVELISAADFDAAIS
ncbi:MAG: hypothetical protein ACK4WC_15080, partial [Rubrimonas sp.]